MLLRRPWFLAVLALVSWRLSAADLSPVGVWKTFDDKTGKMRGTVRVYERGGQFFAKILSIVDPKEAAEICDLCPGDRKNKPIRGLLIMSGMSRHGDEYAGGEILDPDTGKVYHCKFKMTDNGQKLILRGYIGFSLLGRSETWSRAA